MDNNTILRTETNGRNQATFQHERKEGNLIYIYFLILASGCLVEGIIFEKLQQMINYVLCKALVNHIVPLRIIYHWQIIYNHRSLLLHAVLKTLK